MRISNSIILRCETCGRTYSAPLILLPLAIQQGTVSGICPECDHVSNTGRIVERFDEEFGDFLDLFDEEEMETGEPLHNPRITIGTTRRNRTRISGGQQLPVGKRRIRTATTRSGGSL